MHLQIALQCPGGLQSTSAFVHAMALICSTHAPVKTTFPSATHDQILHALSSISTWPHTHAAAGKSRPSQIPPQITHSSRRSSLASGGRSTPSRPKSRARTSPCGATASPRAPAPVLGGGLWTSGSLCTTGWICTPGRWGANFTADKG